MSAPVNSTPITINNIQDYIPKQGATLWGNYTSKTIFDIGTYALFPSGGSFPLTADVDFGDNYGLIGKYFASGSTNPATAGHIRLANTNTIQWRNYANNGNDVLSVNTSDQLIYNGNQIAVGLTYTYPLSLSGTVLSSLYDNTTLNLNGSNQLEVANGGITNTQVSNSASIAYSKLSLTGSIVNTDIYSSAAIDFSKLATLSSGNILVGNGSNVAASVALSGDATLSNAGVLTLDTVNTDVGSYTCSSITVNGKGLITAASSVSAPSFTNETLTNTTNQLALGTTKITTISATAPASSLTYTIPDAGASANMVLDKGNYTIGGTWNFSNSITLSGNSKSLILTDDSTHTVSIKATNSTTTYTLSLPTTGGTSGYVLSTDGSGNTSWIANTPTFSGLTTEGVIYATSSSAVASTAAGATGALLMATTSSAPTWDTTLSGVYTLTGGAGALTLSSSTIAMGSNKITGLAAGSAAGDALCWQQGAGITYVQTSTSTSLSGSSYADVTNLTGSITPRSTSNKILVRIGIQIAISTAASNHTSVSVRLVRGSSTVIATFGEVAFFGGSSLASGDNYFGTYTLEYLDSPATASSTTYKVQAIMAHVGSGSAIINDSTDDTPVSTLTIQEIGV